MLSPMSERADAPPRAGTGLLHTLTGSLSRDSFVYTVATTLTLPLALLTTALLARYLQPSDFGRLAVLFAFAGLLTVVLNLVVLQGALAVVYGGGEEGVEVDDGKRPELTEHARPLGSALVLTAIIAAAGGVAVLLGSRPLAGLLLGDERLQGLVALAGASAAVGSVWRFSTNTLRMERRVVAFSVCNVGRPMLALAITAPLLVAGLGIRAALLGTIAGTSITLALGLAIARRSYAPCLDMRYVRMICRSGVRFAVLIVGLTVVHSIDTLLLSGLTSDASIGYYRIADRLSSVLSYFVSAYLMATVPLEHTTLVRAAYDRYGRLRVRGASVDAFLLIGLYVVLLLSLSGSVLVALLAPGYGPAEKFIPLTASAYLVYGLLITVCRMSEYPHYLRVYSTSAVGAGIVVIGVTIVLVPAWGPIGAPLGMVIGCAIGIAAVSWYSRTRGKALEIGWLRSGGAFGLAIACWMLGTLAAPPIVGWQVAFAVLAAILFPVAAVVTGLVPHRVLRALSTMIRGAFGGRDRRPTSLIAAAGGLPHAERAAVVALTRGGLAPTAAAARLGISRDELARDLVRGLARLTNVSGLVEHETTVGRWLLTELHADRIAAARSLWREGVAAIDMHTVETAYETLRDAPHGAWRTSVVPPDATLVERLRLLPAPERAAIEQVLWARRAPARLPRDQRPVRQPLQPRLVRALRELGSVPGSDATDRLIGSFLFEANGVSARQLWAAGVDPIDVHRLELLERRLRVLRPRRKLRGMLRQPLPSEVDPAFGADGS